MGQWGDKEEEGRGGEKNVPVTMATFPSSLPIVSMGVLEGVDRGIGSEGEMKSKAAKGDGQALNE